MQIQSALTTSPTPALATTTLASASPTPASSSIPPASCRFLPRYQGKKLDDIDLINSIDRLGVKLSSTLTLVDSLQEQFTDQDSNSYNRSTRPARATRSQWLGTDLVVTSTPEGRSARPRPRPRNFVNMVSSDQVSVHTTQSDRHSSSGSSTVSNRATHTMILHHESNGDEERLHPQIPTFPPRHGVMINVVSQDEDPPTRGKTDQQ
jgi:hypothetical protein